jgi:hypothetical protein
MIQWLSQAMLILKKFTATSLNAKNREKVERQVFFALIL